MSTTPNPQTSTIDDIRDPSPYGTCPKCGANGVSRERRPNGNDKCERGHEYPSATANHKKRITPKEKNTMTPDPKTALINQIRDWFAKLDGCTEHTRANGYETQWYWRNAAGDEIDHPYPLTRDGAAKAMPEGYEWSKDDGVWRAWNCPMVSEYTRDTGNEIEDRYRLAAAARIAEGAKEVQP